MQVMTVNGWQPVGRITHDPAVIRNPQPMLSFDFPNGGHVWARTAEGQPFRPQPCQQGCSVCKETTA